MAKVTIDHEKWVSCGWCVIVCPLGVLDTEDDHIVAFSLEDCSGCKECEEQCPEAAIQIQEMSKGDFSNGSEGQISAD